jgi:enamine deaminase RidA (YjgF/YER057c/UK114 family)
MTIKLVRSDSLYNDVPYAYASIVPRGSLIFTAGAWPLDDQGDVVGYGDVRAQASLAVANLATTLGESGATLADVLKTTVLGWPHQLVEIEAVAVVTAGRAHRAKAQPSQ